jgi:hypothetical protein
MTKILEKHKRYQTKYGENELFWGLGIEEETYFQFDKPIYVAAPIIRTAHTAERYSVDYYKTYKSCISASFDSTFPDASGCIPLPFFINAHAFQKMNVRGQHTTTYEKVPKPNPTFSGTTLLTALQGFCPELFKDLYEKSFVFDGDTIEFITQDFYKVTGPAVIKELVTMKSAFLKVLNEYLVAKKIHRDKGLLMYPPKNPGFAVFYSNPQNVVMFNNGTYHINLTLPSLLGPKDASGTTILLYPDEFRANHRRCIRMIQWLEPLLLVSYGTADPFSFSHDGRYASASQRCAVSRYIGIGTYDTDIMKEGKILTAAVCDIKGTNTDFWWYKRYHAMSAYEPLERVGMDINYRKHFNHGIEIRIFDWFPEERLQGLIELLVHLCDAALSREEAPVAVLSPTWNGLVLSILQKGGSHILSIEESALYERIFGCTLMDRGLTVLQALNVISTGIKKKYGKGLCSSLML